MSGIAPKAKSPEPAAQRVYLERKGIQIHNENILDVNLNDNCVDLMVTSPPYGVDIKYATYDDT